MDSALHDAIKKLAAAAAPLYKPRIDELAKLVANDSRFAEFTPESVAVRIKEFFENNNGTKLSGTKALDTLYADVKASSSFMENLLKPVVNASPNALIEATKARELPKPRVTHVYSGGSPSSSAGRFSHLTTDQKFWGGAALVVAAMNAVSAASYLSQGKEIDAQGNSHLNLSNIGWGLANAALATGLFYMGGKHLELFKSI
jgi:hypothetical protein